MSTEPPADKIESVAAAPTDPGCKVAGVDRLKKDDPALGQLRLERLLPYAYKRLNLPLPVTAIPGKDAELEIGSLRRDMKVLCAQLFCGKNFIFELVDKLCAKGVENVRAEDCLKRKSDGGKGKERVPPATAKALTAACHRVCAVDGCKPGKNATREAITARMRADGFEGRMPGRKTIDAFSRAPAILRASVVMELGEHMTRLNESFDPVRGIGQLIQMDGTFFTSKDDPKAILYILNAKGDIIGIGNAIFGLDYATRGIWTALGIVGPVNSFLSGYAVHRGLISKEPLLNRYGIKTPWPWHGKAGKIVTDMGSEFVNDHWRRIFKDRDLNLHEICPPASPFLRGPNERFNRSAHIFFAEFLKYAEERNYLRKVPGKPGAIGIVFSEYDRALVEWVTSYHYRAHKGLGGVSPMVRFEDLANGAKGFRPSGIPPAIPTSLELTWDFLWEIPRVINHVGITFKNRRYFHEALSSHLVPGTRSSKTDQPIRANPYDMGNLLVRTKGDDGMKILPIPWQPEPDKLPFTEQELAAARNCSMWEWDDIHRTHRAAGKKATEAQAIDLAAKRQANRDAKPDAKPSEIARTGRRQQAQREMREQFGKGDLSIPTPPETTTPTQSCAAPPFDFRKVRFLPTGAGGADEY